MSKTESFAFISLTPWCIINKGSMDMSGLYVSGIPKNTPNIPFGDHLAPGTQPGGAFEGQVPKRSLYGLYEWQKSQRVRVG